jgi:hypothetical protein
MLCLKLQEFEVVGEESSLRVSRNELCGLVAAHADWSGVMVERSLLLRGSRK